MADSEQEASGATQTVAPSEIPEQSLGLLRAAHPRQAVLTAAAVGIAAFVSGRPAREAAVAGLAVLVVQAILGLVNDIRDADRDRATGVTGKPIAEGHLPAGNASFVAGCLALVAIPLSLQNGAVAAGALFGYLVAGLLSATALRRSVLSWLPWALSFGLLPAFLAYGGWAGGMHGSPPTYAMTGVAALLGIGVHFLTALPDLVADNKAGVRHLPLRIALKIGAPRLLFLAGAYTAATVVGLLLVAFGSGLRQ
ncbi:MAG: hypothetical protein JWO46_464 [Nocardioidaceae bacterium]|nr:hypothetical protein [Nocardioidaceae bacterium]